MKFAAGNHYHQTIKWLRFGRNWKRVKEQDTTENSNRRQSVLPRCRTGADT